MSIDKIPPRSLVSPIKHLSIPAEPLREWDATKPERRPSVPVQAPEPAPPKAAMSLRFSTDESTGKMVMSVLDPATGEVVRTIPTEEALALSSALDHIAGLLIDLKI